MGGYQNPHINKMFDKKLQNDGVVKRDQRAMQQNGGMPPNRARNRVGESVQASPNQTAEQIRQAVLQATETKLDNKGVYEHGNKLATMGAQNSKFDSAKKEAADAVSKAMAAHKKDTIMREAAANAADDVLKNTSVDSMYQRESSDGPDFGIEDGEAMMPDSKKQLSMDGRQDRPYSASKTLNPRNLKSGKNVINAGQKPSAEPSVLPSDAAVPLTSQGDVPVFDNHGKGESGMKITDMSEQNRNILSKDDNYKKDKAILAAMDNTTPVANNSGMFIIHFDPSVSLEGTTGSDFGAVPTEKDNVASVLRKTAPEMQVAVDDWFGIDENDKNQRLFVSQAMGISDREALCTVVYTGYESENNGEVPATVISQFSNAIDTRVLMSWNHDPYPVTEGQLAAERMMEEKRMVEDRRYASDTVQPVAHGTHTVSLDNSLVSEASADKSMSGPSL